MKAKNLDECRKDLIFYEKKNILKYRLADIDIVTEFYRRIEKLKMRIIEVTYISGESKTFLKRIALYHSFYE